MVAQRRILVPAILAVVAFALFMPVVCAGSSDDSTLGCDTVFGWTLPGSAIDGPEIIIYVIPLALAVIVFAVTRFLLRRRDRAADATTSRS
jgi:phosphotransferase system  glucose/maltose/N-acetylglucosamine-specific IIC component